MFCWLSPTLWRQCCRSPCSYWLTIQVHDSACIGMQILSGIDSEISGNSQGTDGTVSELQNCSMCPGRPNVTFFSSTSAKCQSSLSNMYPGCNTSKIEEGKMARKRYGPSDSAALDVFWTFALYICVFWCVLYAWRRSSFSCLSSWAQIVANTVTFASFFHIVRLLHLCCCCSCQTKELYDPCTLMFFFKGRVSRYGPIRFVCYFQLKPNTT